MSNKCVKEYPTKSAASDFWAGFMWGCVCAVSTTLLAVLFINIASIVGGAV